MFSIELWILFLMLMFSIQLSFLFLVLMFSSGLLLTFTYNQFPKLQVAEVKLISADTFNTYAVVSLRLFVHTIFMCKINIYNKIQTADWKNTV